MVASASSKMSWRVLLAGWRRTQRQVARLPTPKAAAQEAAAHIQPGTETDEPAK